MKTILKLAFLIVVLAIAQSNSQTWKELTDSANFYKEVQDHETALKWARLAVMQAEKEFGLKDTNYISSLVSLSECNYNTGNRDSAAFYCNLSFKSAKELFKGDHLLIAKINFTLGVLEQDQGRLSEAESLFKEAIDMSRRVNKTDNPDLASSINSLAGLYRNQGRLSEAEPLFKEALEMTRRIEKEDHYVLIYGMLNLANLYQSQGRLSEAEALSKEAYEMARRLYKNDHPNLELCLKKLGNLYLAQGRLSESESLLKPAVDMMRRLFQTDHPELANSLSDLGNLYQTQGRITEAEALYKEALDMKRRYFKGNHPDLVVNINNLGTAYLSLGKYSEAEQLFKEAISLYRLIFMGDNPELASSLHNLSQVYQKQGRFPDAQLLAKETLEMTSRLYKGDHINKFYCLNNLADIYQSQDSLANSEELFVQSLDMSRRIFKGDHPIIVVSLNNLGAVYQAEGKLQKSEMLEKEALEMNRRLFKGDHPITAYILNNLNHLYRLEGRFTEAEPLMKESLDMNRRLFNANHPNVIRDMRSLAVLYQSQGRLAEAEVLFIEALKSIVSHLNSQFPYLNENQKIQFWRTKQSDINTFYGFAASYSKHKPEIREQMADIILATKGIVHKSTKKAFEDIRESKRLFEDWQNTRQFWINLVQNPQRAKRMGINVDSVETEAQRLEAEISKQSVLFKKMVDTSLVRWKDVRANLSPGQAAVEIVRFIDRSRNDSLNAKYAFIITKFDSKYPELVILENGNDLETRYIKQYKDLLENEKKKKQKSSISAVEDVLYREYWKKVQDQLSGINVVFVSLDGIYNQFNLNTLRDVDANKYILDKIDIRVVTSTRDLAERKYIPKNLNFTKNESLDAVLFGDPKFNLKERIKTDKLHLQLPKEIMPEGLLTGVLAKMASEGITPLPGTKFEVEKVSADVENNGLKSYKFTQASAMKSKLMEVKNPRILHIATHGLFLKDIEYLKEDRFGLQDKKFYDNPLLKSMLLLSGAENTLRGEPVSEDDDGILTAYEVMNLDLDKTELVVLSACETGLGEVRNGEGVFGLQRAFQTAGAKSIIMSLWKVDDRATQELMNNFYTKWLRGMEKRAAFREAQIELKAKYPGFYYWGAFVMVGE